MQGSHCNFLDCPLRYEDERNKICQNCDGRPSTVKNLRAGIKPQPTIYQIPERKIIKGGIILTEEDIEFLKANHKRYTAAELSKIMGLKESKIAWEKYRLRLVKRQIKSSKGSFIPEAKISEPKINIETISENEIKISIEIYLRREVIK